ncbi:hypothetical protein [Bacillus tuaregi]|uniref:hypothetical protein n=1 Tax=Bacillus tuaregi TaxID=1816695 RepID=UPI0008F8FC41|nr:hypothetical protein [Bacillus tuaregi]
MSMKSVEMQIAIPRTMDTGKLQEQLQQRGRNLVEHAGEAVQKDVEHNKSRTVKNEEAGKTNWMKEKDERNQNHKKRSKLSRGTDVIQQEHHPYKGKIIDYSG